ncbi:OmpP1/FadL family transporter [Desulfurobacterium indicum]|uniref:Aromatic hydrocarbon degradation protein n=1 Tax=Desulfurobacterium indicum TaxID=1914305 RepID=A0A1R1MM85_9BACT|nr:outer membrane protein transport protein [Desulfurobacterium indicum]OMH40938.1 aromatic hydrocarbon degradation protein [Desulfurobacterium indicum]
MRKKLLTLLAVAVVAGGMSQKAFATNGDDMIGVSPVSRAMGGIGVGMPICATDALYRNPAWMSKSKNFEVSFGSTLFLPDVKASATTPLGTVEATSKADTFVIPEFSITQRLNEKVVVGLGAFGVSGMGTDYRNADSTGMLMNMNTNFSFMRMMPAVSYKISDNLSMGAALHLTWGSLDMGDGYSQDFGIGGNIGLAYETDMLSLGFSYMSPVSMTYKRVYDSNGDGVYEDMKLEQPQEVAAGVGVKPIDGLKVGFDVRWINWADADGYKQFGWNNQIVYALGAEYKATEALTLRAGFNYAKSPLDDVSAASNDAPTITVPDLAAPFNEYFIGVMNALGFPVITETHITIGAGYKVSEHFTINVAYVHAFEGDFKVEDTSNAYPTYEAKNAQNSISMGLHWNF